MSSIIDTLIVQLKLDTSILVVQTNNVNHIFDQMAEKAQETGNEITEAFKKSAEEIGKYRAKAEKAFELFTNGRTPQQVLKDTTDENVGHANLGRQLTLDPHKIAEMEYAVKYTGGDPAEVKPFLQGVQANWATDKGHNNQKELSTQFGLKYILDAQGKGADTLLSRIANSEIFRNLARPKQDDLMHQLGAPEGIQNLVTTPNFNAIAKKAEQYGPTPEQLAASRKHHEVMTDFYAAAGQVFQAGVDDITPLLDGVAQGLTAIMKADPKSLAVGLGAFAASLSLFQGVALLKTMPFLARLFGVGGVAAGAAAAGGAAAGASSGGAAGASLGALAVGAAGATSAAAFIAATAAATAHNAETTGHPLGLPTGNQFYGITNQLNHLIGREAYGIRANNPGYIPETDATGASPVGAEHTKNLFDEHPSFPTPQLGLVALRDYLTKTPGATMRSIFDHYNFQWVASHRIPGEIGASPDLPLTQLSPAQLGQLMHNIIQQQNGSDPYGSLVDRIAAGQDDAQPDRPPALLPSLPASPPLPNPLHPAALLLQRGPAQRLERAQEAAGSGWAGLEPAFAFPPSSDLASPDEPPPENLRALRDTLQRSQAEPFAFALHPGVAQMQRVSDDIGERTLANQQAPAGPPVTNYNFTVGDIIVHTPAPDGITVGEEVTRSLREELSYWRGNMGLM